MEIKTYTLQERLQIYKRALETFEMGVKKGPAIAETLNVDAGFCWYFNSIGINIYPTWTTDPTTGQKYKKIMMEEIFPELYKQKPSKLELYGYWFNASDILIRIVCLEKAIELTEKQIEDVHKRKTDS